MRQPNLRHVYATLAELNDTLVTSGSVGLTNTANNARKLEMLDEVSRLIDARARRGSGFGPWVGTQRYDGDSRDTLYLRADLASLSTLTIAPSQGATPVTPVVTTDFLLDGFDGTTREIFLHGRGSPTQFGSARQGVAVTGTWSYPYRVRVLTPTTAEALDSSETEIDVSGLTGLSPGMTILVDAEQMYVSAVTDSTTDSITVERGVNGTTAASHNTAAAISRYVYHPSINTLALALAERRWKAHDAGADGTDGGGDLGITVPRKSERNLINEMLTGIRLVGSV